jgi:hypothetical protein
MTTDTEMEVFESDLNAGPGYYWRVRSIESGDSGPWSDAQFFRHFPEGSSVLPPLLNAPADGSTVSSYDVILEWQAESGAQRYGFEVAEDNQFQFLVYEDVVPGTTPTVTGDALMSGTQYYWRVRSIDDANSSSNWSAVRSFQYSPGGGGVGLVLPQDGESLTGNVYFEWQSYTGSEFLQEYVLLINDTQDFSSPLYNASMGAGTSVTVQASHFGAAGTYYWEVVTQTDGGDYSSERRSFSWSP